MEAYCTTEEELQLERAIEAMQAWVSFDFAYIAYRETSTITVFIALPVVFSR